MVSTGGEGDEQPGLQQNRKPRIPVKKARIPVWKIDIKTSQRTDYLSMLSAAKAAGVDWLKMKHAIMNEDVLCDARWYTKDTDEKLCAECGLPDDNPKTNYITCDQCDDVWHFECAGVEQADIPDGDWFCKKCNPEATSEASGAGTSIKREESGDGLGSHPAGAPKFPESVHAESSAGCQY